MNDSNDDLRDREVKRSRSLAVLTLLAGALYAAPLVTELGSARASGGGRGGGSGVVATATEPTTKKECGACHMAYPPNTLPAGSWRAIMSDLGNHFGDDASLNAATSQKITDYLVNNAGGWGQGPLRITETRWFMSEHGKRRFANRTKSLANCTECHQTQDGNQARSARF